MSYKFLQSIKEILAQFNLKATHQRIVIYQALKESTDHPTAEMVYEKIHRNNPSISLGTIYKTLETFVEKGLTKRVNTAEGTMRYDAFTENHNHIYCENTKEIIDYRDLELDTLISDFLRNKNISNFDLKDVRLHIIGNKINPAMSVEVKQNE